MRINTLQNIVAKDDLNKIRKIERDIISAKSRIETESEENTGEDAVITSDQYDKNITFILTSVLEYLIRKKITLRDLFKNEIYFDKIEDNYYEVIDLQNFSSVLSNQLGNDFELLDISCFYTKFKRNTTKENIDFGLLMEEIELLQKENKLLVDEQKEKSGNEIQFSSDIELSATNSKSENGIANTDILQLVNDYLLKNMLTLREFFSPLKSSYIVDNKNNAKVTYLSLEQFKNFVKEKLSITTNFVLQESFKTSVIEETLVNNQMQFVVNLTNLDKLINKMARKIDTSNRCVSKYQK